ncbi:MAG: hypothetical protein Q7K40_04525 [bacterium]|nr:hypothetical protein [bacterium]
MRNKHSPFPIPRYSLVRGALLLELLVAISILAIILSIGSQAVYVSMQSGKTSGENDVAMGLANETLEAVRAVADEKWQNIYNLTGKGITHYKTAPSSGLLTVTSGDETILLNNASYTRYFIVDNVSRCNDSSRSIASSTICTPVNNYFNDPSTQKVSVVVSWQGAGSPLTINNYLFRWKNKICNQADWSGGVATGVKTCSNNTYEAQDGNINTSGTTLELQS